MNRITPAWITDLRPGEIFVFGSNVQGRHGKGAAKIAAGRFGAVMGQGFGLMGESFGIPTRTADLYDGRKFTNLPLERIGFTIALFLDHAHALPNHRYLVTEIGCGLAGYTPAQIAPLFLLPAYINQPNKVPANVCLPISFWRVLLPDRL